ncbi:M48 family metallopeptidase [Sphingomonas sp.]|uniref:M48 family metallopeptidase n=1 Tax=Sphingomonas sp. TaxID=28214 RepID=UPI001D78A561|nr:M48 family metallopeptidase [Sphingomonas sp.]MBX9797234.1 M48 family metallopeptidase [Sphingomonas sp.]
MSALSEDPADAAQGWHYDGETAIRHRVRAFIDGGHLHLVGAGEAFRAYRLVDLVAQPAQGSTRVYGLKARPGWQLGLEGPLPDGFAAQLPGAARYGGVIDRLGLWPAAALFAVIAAVTLVGLSYVPGVVVALVPRSVERQLGDAMVGDFGGRLCAAPAGQAALDTLARRLGADPAQARIEVAAIPMVNAVTLPGGRVIIFEGLLKQAESADEVAGVTGHELGHVAHRDVLATLVRQLGLSFLLGGLEGNVRGYTDLVLSSAYSRQAETAADGFAIDAMAHGDISPAATAAFFNRLSGGAAKKPGTKGEKSGVVKAAEMLDYVSSHPNSAGRAERFAAAARGHGGYAPVLTPVEWQALRTICSADPKVKRGNVIF